MLTGPPPKIHGTRDILALLMVSLAVVAGVSAPAADALPSCQDSGSTSTCQTNGSVSIKARPGTVAAPANQPVIRWGRHRYAHSQ